MKNNSELRQKVKVEPKVLKWALSSSGWEEIYNPNFNYGEFATIRSKAGLYNHRGTLNG